MLRGFVGWLVGLSAAITLGALIYGRFATIPLLVWLPLLGMAASLFTLVSLLFFSWGADWKNARLNWASHYALIALYVFMGLTVLALLLKAGPL
jgi:hypothetical protein